MKKLIASIITLGILLFGATSFGADTKGSALPTATPLATDLLYLIDDPGGTPSSKGATVQSIITAIYGTAYDSSAELDALFAGKQGVDSDLTAISALSTTAYGRALLELADQSALQTAVNVEDGATADQTGAEIKTLYEAEADTNAYTDAEKTKLSGIEASADVTDAANVAAAGAAMDGGAHHDGFSDFVANEHIDWTQDQGATNIHSGNYTDTDTNTNASTECAGDTTYYSGEGNCNDISSVYEAADSAIAKTDEAETISANWVNTANPWAENEIVSTVVVEGDVDDTPIDLATTDPVSSNWAYNHANASNPHSLDAEDVLPSQTGNSGKFLTTNGSVSSWGSVPGGGDLLSTNNLSDVANPATSLSNLGGIGSAGVTFENLDGNSDVGTGAAQVAAGDHTHAGVYEPVDATILKEADVDDTPINDVTTAPISSNWAYDHVDAADPHNLYLLKSQIGVAYDTEAELNTLFNDKEDADAAIVKSDEAETITTQWDFSNNAPTVPTEVYGAGWNADDGVPTKDAVYDKIEAMSVGDTISEGDSFVEVTDAGTGEVVIDVDDEDIEIKDGGANQINVTSNTGVDTVNFSSITVEIDSVPVTTSSSAFGTDNMLLKSDGTGRKMQATGIEVDDNDVINPQTSSSTLSFHASDTTCSSDFAASITATPVNGAGTDDDTDINWKTCRAGSLTTIMDWDESAEKMTIAGALAADSITTTGGITSEAGIQGTAINAGTPYEVTDADAESFTATQYRKIWVQTGGRSTPTTITLPAEGISATGHSKEFMFHGRDDDDGDEMSIDPNGASDEIYLNGTACGAGDTITCQEPDSLVHMYGYEATNTIWFAHTLYGTCACD